MVDSPKPSPSQEMEHDGKRLGRAVSFAIGKDASFDDSEEGNMAVPVGGLTAKQWQENIFRRNPSENTSRHNRSSHVRTSSDTDRIIKRLSSSIDVMEESVVDMNRLARATKDAGEDACGILAVEVWILDEEDHGKLVRPEGGWWRDASLMSEALDRLEVSSHPQYVPPDPVVPGVDLPGELFYETCTSKFAFSHRSPRCNGTETQSRPGMVWRDLRSLVEDPDTAKTDRLSLLEKAGFEKAAGVPFEANDHKGIVIYYTSSCHNEEEVRSVANEAYMVRAATLIGSVIAACNARRATVALRVHGHKFTCANSDRASKSDMGSSTGKRTDAASTTRYSAVLYYRVKIWFRKFWGGNLQIPPALGVWQSLFTFCGAFCGLLFLIALHEYAKAVEGPEKLLVLGLMGSLVTLQFGLTAAPAGQPRNIMFGHAVAGFISMCSTYISDDIVSPWLRQVVAPSVAITVMVKLGITHPPAGGVSVILSSGQFGWRLYFCVLISCATTFIPAMTINNMNQKRQYPTYWGILPPLGWVRGNHLSSGGSTKESEPQKPQFGPRATIGV